MPSEIKKAEKIVETNPDSALHILKQIYPTQKLSDANRALYGIVLFKALTIKDQPLQPDSVISFSFNYYQNTNDQLHLAQAYYYKARLLKKAQQFDNATTLYIKALDLIQNSNYYGLLGDINSDLGDICSIQKDYKVALRKFSESMNNYKNANDTLKSAYKIVDIARVYTLWKNYTQAIIYYKKSLAIGGDSILRGQVFQGMGIYYYRINQFDSAKYFFQKSLQFPYKGTNYAIRCVTLADLYYDMNQFDSAFYYATKSLSYPATFFNKRDCYRILANTKYQQGDFKAMATYMTQYQNYSDSVRKIETQVKTSVLENIHEKDGTTTKFKSYLLFIGSASVVIIGIGLFMFFKLKRRNKTKEVELNKATETISKNQTLLRENLIRKIEETKAEKNVFFKKLSISEKEKILIEIYNQCLKLKYWNEFTTLMNQTFNNLIIQLETHYTDLNHKEITWICLFLLDVPLTDMVLILENQTGSIYKLKQRVTQKLNLSSTKELESVLQTMSSKI